MKITKFFIGLAFALIAGSASAQDFSDPQYAKWGETPEQRKENILARKKSVFILKANTLGETLQAIRGIKNSFTTKQEKNVTLNSPATVP